MKLLLIRHGDPDYEKDSLTEKGWKEAAFLAERISQLDVKEFYCSPLGRAKDTASLTLQKMNRTATQCQWLREFAPKIARPDIPEHPSISWDWLPQDWTSQEEFYRHDLWYTNQIMNDAKVKEEYQWVIQSFDQLLAEHGYVRESNYYRVENPNRDTLVFFCHFGLTCVLLSHILNISPMVLWHSTCTAPTSVTTIYTEERRKGIASLRVSSLGDTSHLYCHKEPPAFSARFCETFDCFAERHD